MAATDGATTDAPRPFRGAWRLPAVLVAAGLALTGCLGMGDSGGSQVGAGTGGGATTAPAGGATSTSPGAGTVGAGTTAQGSTAQGSTATTAPATLGTVAPPPTAPPTTTPTTFATTTTTLPLAPGAPNLTAVSPAAAPPGQVVTLAGTGLVSSNGVITVLFGKIAAGVSCQTTTACQATVPSQPTPVPASTPVTFVTDHGSSHPVPFTTT